MLLSSVAAELYTFVFHTGENAEKLLQFKRWFWSIVEKMSMTERQDLVSCPFPMETCRRVGVTGVNTYLNSAYLQRLCEEQGSRVGCKTVGSGNSRCES